MKLFGWKMAGRAAARPVLSRVYGAPLSWGEWPRSYEAQVREGYLDNAVAQRAVRLVAEGAAATPFSASDARAGALVRTTSAGQHLIESVAMHLLLHGKRWPWSMC